MIVISKDKSLLNTTIIHSFITNSYWGRGRTLEQVKKTIKHCLCFGVYKNNTQIGFARIATDYTIFAYIMDVFILPEYRGNGYSKQLMEHIMNDEGLQECTIWMLKTSDAHGLYKQYGFTTLESPEKLMEKIIKE